MGWLDLLAVQGTLKSLFQHHSSKASILQCSAFFIVQLSHPYMTTGKTIALTRWIFVGKVMSLLFIFLFIYFLSLLFNLLSAAAAAKSRQSCLTLCDPIDGSATALFLGFSRQEYWSGLPFPPRLVINFLPRSKHLLVSWLQSPSAVILEPRKIVWHCFHCLPIYFPLSDGTRCHDLSFLNVELSANFFTVLFHFHQEAF